jgi:hypothetical protein
LKDTLKSEFSEDELANKIYHTFDKWSWLYQLKSSFLIRLQFLIPQEMKELSEFKEEFKNIPSGPVNQSIFESMSFEEKTRYLDANKLLPFKNYSTKELMGICVSEHFFHFESMCRLICIGSCFEFALKSILAKNAIQHDEIYKTMNRLNNPKKDKESCIFCPIKSQCNGKPYFLILSNIYVLFYHLRVIKDYKIQFFSNRDFYKFLIKDFLIKGFKLSSQTEKIVNKIYSGYVFSPFLLERDIENIKEALERYYASKKISK